MNLVELLAAKILKKLYTLPDHNVIDTHIMSQKFIRNMIL